MPKSTLTQLAVERIGPPKSGRVEYWDKHLRGFGLRVSASGAKSWQVMYRVKGGPQVRETLGTLAAIPNVADARKRALDSIEKARAGLNPVSESRAVAVAEQRRTAESVAAVVDRFMREHVERKCRASTVAEYRRLFAKDVVPHWAGRPISSITKREVNDLLDRKAERRPLQANEIRKHLRTFFAWAVDAELVAGDPTAGTRLRAKAVARDRALSAEEIKLFWAGCDRLGWPFGPIGKLLLLTAQRRDEVGGMSWSEIDLERRLWTLPRERAKNDRAHEVHLSAFAIEIIEALPNTGALVFSTTGGTPPSGYSNAKERLDRFMFETSGGNGIEPWTFHDLRRTAATGMAKLGIAPHVVDGILNHVSGTVRGVAAVYNRHIYFRERSNALDAWGRDVESLVRPGGAGNFVDLRGRAATA